MDAGGRATLHFQPAGELPLTITVEGVGDATWGFGEAPALRIPWRYAGVVVAVRFASVRSFGESADPARGRAVRVEVDIEGSPTIALEGSGVLIGPVLGPPPAPPQSS